MAAPFPYATHEELETFIETAYEFPLDTVRIRTRASELIQEAIGGRQITEWVTDLAHLASLREATCAQVEFWLEVGEEFDVAGVPSEPMSFGGVQLKAPMILARRARRHLFADGLVSGLVGAAW